MKANYGLYWHNPGVGISGNANPNTANKSATYTWTDLNGDRRWQPGEQAAAFVSADLEGTTGLDPNIKDPYTHEVSVVVRAAAQRRRWVCVPASSTRPKTI